MIIDTDVMIWFLRGNQKAIDFIMDAMPFSISIVTYMELVQGGARIANDSIPPMNGWVYAKNGYARKTKVTVR